MWNLTVDAHLRGLFYSSLFLDPKKNGHTRPVINLKQAGDTVLQDGGYLYPMRTPESQRLMVKVDLNLLTSSFQFILNIKSI